MEDLVDLPLNISANSNETMIDPVELYTISGFRVLSLLINIFTLVSNFLVIQGWLYPSVVVGNQERQVIQDSTDSVRNIIFFQDERRSMAYRESRNFSRSGSWKTE